MKRRIHGFVVLSCAVFLSGCGGDRTMPTPTPPTAPSPPTAAPTPPAAATPRSITVTCASATLSNAGEHTQCTAIVTYSDRTTQDQTNTVSWSAADSRYATVDATGLVTALKAGAVTIWASYPGRIDVDGGTFRIDVALPPIARVSGQSSWIQDAGDATFDASESSDGVDQSYRFDFGDGTVKTEPFTPIGTTRRLFQHTYRSRGTFAATLTLVDRQGRRATASTTIKIESLTGTWLNVLTNAASGRTERRSLELVQAAGGGLTGMYVHPEGNREPLTGKLDEYGGIRMALVSNTIKFGGSDLDGNRIRAASAFTVAVKGGSADGLMLTFTRQ